MELTLNQAMKELEFWRTEYRKAHNTLKQVQEILELNQNNPATATANALAAITKSPDYPCQLCGRIDCNGNHDDKY